MSIVQTQGDQVLSAVDGQVVSPAITSTSVTAGAAAQAVATLAAGTGSVKHVLYGVVASIACGATAQTPIEIQALDGATVIFRAQVAAPADGCGIVQVMGLHIEGTAATAMKLQFAGAGVAASVQSATLLTYDVA